MKKGFTVLELLICIAITSVLATTSVVSYKAVTNKAEDAKQLSENYNEDLLTKASEIDQQVGSTEVSGTITVSTLGMIPEELQSSAEPTVISSGDTLYVVGSGPMDNYLFTSLPEYLSDTVTTIIVQDGITSVGDFAFFKLTGLTDVYLPSSVKTIGKYAFYEDTNLLQINAEDLTEINCYAFYGCQGLTFTTTATCGPLAVEFLGDDQYAHDSALLKAEAMKDYLNDYYLTRYPELGFDIDYCSDADLKLLTAAVSEITAGCTSDDQKASAIYNWVEKNIKYAYDTVNFSPIDVYKNKNAVCSGHAQLLSTFFKLSGIPAAVVRVYSFLTEFHTISESNSYLGKKAAHELVLAYVDNDWYGYDSTNDWYKLDTESLAKRFTVLHVDGIMTGFDVWDVTTPYWKNTEVWYTGEDIKFLGAGTYNSDIGSSGMGVGGCLRYSRSTYWKHFDFDYYYTYQGTEQNVPGLALRGGVYTRNVDEGIAVYDGAGVKETSYWEYQGHKYFSGVKVDNVIPDIGLTDNCINLYLGETIDFSSIYPNCTIGYSQLSNKKDSLSFDGTTLTAIAEGKSRVEIIADGHTYSLNFYVKNSVLDYKAQELCEHDYTYYNDSAIVCAYCGKCMD